MLQRPKFVFEEQQQQAPPHIESKVGNNQNSNIIQFVQEKPSIILRYSQLEDHVNGSAKIGKNENNDTLKAKDLQRKITHLEDAKEMKPNLFFRSQNQSPIPADMNKNLTIQPTFKPTQFDPYKYLGSRPSKKDYQIFLDGKMKRKKKENKAETEQKIHDSNSSQVVLDVPQMKQHEEVQERAEVIQQPNKKEDELLLEIHPVSDFKAYSFTIDKKIGENYFYPQYKIWSNDANVLVSAKKEAFHVNSLYNIFVGDIKNEKKLGTLQGNFGGTEFNIHQIKESGNELLATIIYKAEVSCNAFRKVQVYVKKPDTDLKQIQQAQNLKQLYESGSTDQIIKIVTKQPVWRQDLQSYVMNFKGKSKMSSTKNMILINEQNPSQNSLLFCKRQYNKFYLQISYPLNLLVSMGILISGFDFKLLCQ